VLWRMSRGRPRGRGCVERDGDSVREDGEGSCERAGKRKTSGERGQVAAVVVAKRSDMRLRLLERLEEWRQGKGADGAVLPLYCFVRRSFWIEGAEEAENGRRFRRRTKKRRRRVVVNVV
jgi:hypothetical protein